MLLPSIPAQHTAQPRPYLCTIRAFINVVVSCWVCNALSLQAGLHIYTREALTMLCFMRPSFIQVTARPVVKNSAHRSGRKRKAAEASAEDGEDAGNESEPDVQKASDASGTTGSRSMALTGVAPASARSAGIPAVLRLVSTGMPECTAPATSASMLVDALSAAALRRLHRLPTMPVQGSRGPPAIQKAALLSDTPGSWACGGMPSPCSHGPSCVPVGQPAAQPEGGSSSGDHALWGKGFRPAW